MARVIGSQGEDIAEIAIVSEAEGGYEPAARGH